MSRYDNQLTTAPKSQRVAPVQRSPEASAWDVQAANSPQRTLGNQALARRVDAAAPTVIQTKMVVGPAQDAHEVEADAVAEKVVGNIQASQVQRQGDEPEIQMKPVEVNMLRREAEEDEMESTDLKRDTALAQRSALVQREEEEDEMESVDAKRDTALAQRSSLLQREEEEDEMESVDAKRDTALAQRSALLQREEEEDEMESVDAKRDSAGGMEGGVVGEDVESQIRAQRGGGSAIPDAPRAALESGFGADFSGVRVHQGSGADSLNRSLSAKAFTSGSDIFFRSGEYDPGSKQGQQLLAHELTHVVQQGAAQQNA